MSGPAFTANRWPRWLRISLVGVSAAIILSGGLFTYRYFEKAIVLTVAAGSADGEALSLISAVSARLADSGSHVRLKVVDSGTSARASEMLATGEAELALVRGDTSNLSNARSILLLTHGVALILAPAGTNADNVADLRDIAIGVIGGRVNHPVVDALNQVYELDRAHVLFVDVAIAEGAAALSSGKVQALLAVVPLTEKYLVKVKQYFQQSGKNTVPKLIAIESAGAIANLEPYYESYDIPKGTLRGAPPVPSDDLTSLRVSFFLVANKSVNADTVTDLTQSLVGVRRDLLSEYPILAEAGAPSTDPGALIPIHPGAATYYGGNQQSFLDKYDDKLYYGVLVVGSLISVVAAAWRFAGSGPQSMLEPLYELGIEVQNAKSEAELETIEKRIDEILKAELASNVDGENPSSTDMAALSLAAHRLQYLMSHRRTVLHRIPVTQS
jgi:TRAP-type uncharacterized transport system substrate-binding protein